MVGPVTGGLIAGGLLSAAGGVLGAAADLHGLGAPRALRQLIDRFEAAPDETQVFYTAIWKAAVRATHGCVQQVYDHTATTDDIRGDTPSWDRFRETHARVRKVPEWSDAPTLPQALQDALTRDLAHTLRAQTQPEDAGPSSAAQAVWASYCSALRDAGMQGEPPAVIRQAFFGERPEAKVWPWSRHFALRIGEQLRDDAGFKAMFDAEQFAWIGTGVARLVKEFTAVEQMLSEMSVKLDAVHGIAERTEQNTLQLRGDNQQMMDVLRDIQRRLPAGAIDLNEEIERLRQRPDIHLEDLVGWLQTALKRSDPLPPDELPRLLQHALTVDLPKLRAEAERYRLDPLASPEAQALLDEVRALLHPKAGTPLDLQRASEKLKALDDRVVAERAARRRDEDQELAQLRVLRAEAERSMAHHAAAAELMEQAARLCHRNAQKMAFNEQAAEDWFHHGELHPGTDALRSAIRLLRMLIIAPASREDAARLHHLLGNAEMRLGQRVDGEAGLEALHAAVESYRAALEVRTRAEMPLAWAATQNNQGASLQILGVRLQGEAGLRALRAAEATHLAALEVHTRTDMPIAWAMTQNNLGNVQQILGERLDGEPGLQALFAAEVSYRAALEVITRADMPVDWAMTHSNLATVQSNLGARLGGELGLQSLFAAEESYHLALEVLTRADRPVAWAVVHDNLGTVQCRLGERLYGAGGLDELRAAELSYRTALEVRTRVDMPVAWAMTQNNLSNALRCLGKRLNGEAGLQALRTARLCCLEALEVFVHDTMPAHWNIANQNLSRIEELIAERGG